MHPALATKVWRLARGGKGKGANMQGYHGTPQTNGVPNSLVKYPVVNYNPSWTDATKAMRGSDWLSLLGYTVAPLPLTFIFGE